MKWFMRTKTAAHGHGDTMNGQFYDSKLASVKKRLSNMVASTADHGPKVVLPRWRGQIRREILMLPAVDRIHKMSMYELESLEQTLDMIADKMKKYSVSRFREITGL